MTSSPLSVSTQVNILRQIHCLSKKFVSSEFAASFYHLRNLVFTIIQIAGISGHPGQTALTGNVVSKWEPRPETEPVCVMNSHHSELNPAQMTVTRPFPVIRVGVLTIVL